MEHLESGDGLVGDELVPEQAGIHRASPRAPARTAAVIDGERVHSNIHVGEQHWGTNPRDGGEWPVRSLSVEVDYYEPAAGQEALNSEWWTGAVERNLRLYGVNATLTPDEVLTRRDLVTCSGAGGQVGADDPALGCVDETTLDSGFTPTELEVIRFHNESLAADEYTLVAHKLSLPIETLGLNLREAPSIGLSMRDVEGVATERNAGRHVGASPYATGIGLAAGKVQLHELGHSLHIGERDDATFAMGRLRINETYSGSRLDDTPESLRRGLDEWSVMGASWDTELVRVPMNGRYYAFSLEELATVGDP